MIGRSLVGIVTPVAAGLVNLLVVAAILWATYYPIVIHGPRPKEPDFATLVLLVYPALNLAALARGLASPRARFVLSVFYLNAALAAGALLFGIASALELTFSPLERFLTALLLTPPLATVLGLRVLRRAAEASIGIIGGPQNNEMQLTSHG